MDVILLEKEKMAQAMNFGKYPVLSVDLDNKLNEDDDYAIGCECRVAWDRDDGRYNGMTTKCTLKIVDGKYFLNNPGTIIKACHGVDDFVEDIRRANLPLVHKGQTVAVAHYSKELDIKFVRVMKVSDRIDILRETVATLEDF